MKHFILFISLVLATGAFAQESFFQEYFSENFEEGTDIIKRDDNSYILGGWSRSYKGEEFQFLKIVDLAGTEISTKYISSENASRGHLICQDYDNMILILRDSTINDTSYMIISKVNFSGEEIESHAVMPGHGFGIVKDDEQGYYIIGKKDHQKNTLVVNLDNSFNVTWDQEYYPSLQNGQKTTTRSAKILNNNLYVIGDYYDSPGYGIDGKSFILCISESGDSLNCLNLDEYYNEAYNSLITTSDGNLITTGNYGLYYYEGNGSILKLTPDLDTIWHNSFYYDYGMYCDDLIETSDGDIIVCGGQFKSNFSSSNFFLKKNKFGRRKYMV
ncbi:MAG: hypothetical protein EOL88_09320 [Bacteroidia bacterium]|nr:hypothetical protein [Bacteroidales bacterium]MDD3962095.1 hypothetical protein [Bacteroidales bacterium]NCD42278.1 hypothetical protein [Bacteroidia bacterium]